MFNPKQLKKLIKAKLFINFGPAQNRIVFFILPNKIRAPTRSWAQGTHMVKSIPGNSTHWVFTLLSLWQKNLYFGIRSDSYFAFYEDKKSGRGILSVIVHVADSEHICKQTW